MTRTKIILAVSMLVVFVAGVSLGLLIPRPHKPPHERSRLAVELDLTAAQAEKMDKIWRDAMLSLRQQGERRFALPQEREQKLQAFLTDDQRTQWDAIQKETAQKTDELSQQREQKKLALLTDEQRTGFEATQKEYAHKMEEATQERKKTFDAAVEQTKKILSPSQAAKYEEWLKNQRERGPGGFHGPRKHRSAPASRPTPKDELPPPPPPGGEFPID